MLAPTQWNVVAAPTGGLLRLGLRYEALPVVFDALDVPRGTRARVLRDLPVMEAVVRRAQDRG